jgi:uncharacterized membrane protein
VVSTLEASLIVFAVAGLPLVTMRLGIGLGIFVYGLDPVLVCLLAIASNLLVIAPVWFLFPHIERACRRSARLSLLLDRVFARTRKETAKRQALEEVGIFVIVALTGVPFPLPGSGLYTGLLAQYIFGLPMRKALPWHVAGIVVACVALTLQAVLGDAALRQFFHV